MFKEIIAVWKGDNFLSGILDDFTSMLENDLWMFENAISALKDEGIAAAIKEELYSRDRNVNQREQQIRKHLVEHLAINPREDFVACLVFMSVVKDAERIGDYSKNIFELNAITASKLDDDFAYLIMSLTKKVKEDLEKVISAFKDSDKEEAKAIMIRHKDISSNVESLIRSLAIRKEFPSDKVVVYTLFLRYLKRVSSHTANVASAIVNPLEKIDFAVEGDL